jgi:hypothetical protein
MQVVHSAFFKSEVLVEGFGLRGNGGDKDCSRAN